MAKTQRVVSFVEKIPRKKLFLLIVIYLLIALFVWHSAMNIYYYGEFNIFLREDNSNKIIVDNLIEKGIYSKDGINPTGIAAPFYPFLLLLLIKLFGSSYKLVLVAIQIVLSIIIGLALFKITERIFRSRTAGLISVVLYSIHAELAIGLTFNLRENAFFTFFLFLFVYILADEKITTKKVMVAALLVALANLIRPTGILLFGVLILWIFYYSWKQKNPFGLMLKKYLIPAIFVFLIMVSPWLIYQSNALGSVVLTTSTSSGTNFLKGNNPVTEKIYPYIDTDVLAESFDSLLKKKGISKFEEEMVKEKYYVQLTLAYIKENPGTFLKLCLVKLFAFYSPLSTPMGHGDMVKKDGEIRIENFKLGAINMVFFPFMFILYGGLISFFVYKKKIKTNFAKITFLTFLLFTTSHVILSAESRHRFPLDPLWIAFAAGGYFYLWNIIKKWKKIDKDTNKNITKHAPKHSTNNTNNKTIPISN